jgi:hypothetical protein
MMQAHIHTVLGWARTIYLYVYTVYIRCLKQGNHHTYGHIRCVYRVLANTIHTQVSMCTNVLIQTQPTLKFLCGEVGKRVHTRV